LTLIRRHRWLQALLLLGPAATWGIVFIIVPTVVAVMMSLWEIISFRLIHHWTLQSYRDFLSTAIYHDPFVRSIENGLIVGVICVVVSIPLAHFIRFRVRRHRAAFFGSVVIALWMGYLLRIFGWRIILGNDGPLNKLLMSAGIIDHPLTFLVFSRFAVILAQTHLAMAFAFIPIYAAMERLPESLLQAGADLGANRRRQFFSVELPLVSFGVITGGTFAFVLAFGDYFAPVLVGNPSGLTAGNIAADQFGAAFNWPLGAVIGVFMMITVFVALGIPAVVGGIRGRFVARFASHELTARPSAAVGP
jgi:spermidine/putrescine transport system permease protein